MINNKSLRKSTSLIDLVSFFSFKIILDFSAVYILHPTFYPSFFIDVNFNKILESYLLLFVVFLTIPRKTKVSTLFVWIFIFLSYIPMLTVYGLANESREWMYINTGFWIITSLILKGFKNKFLSITKISIKEAKAIKRIIYFLCFTYTLLIFLSLRSLFLSIDLVEIYAVRNQFHPLLPFASYLINWTGLVINPIFITVFFIRKQCFFLLLSCMVQFFLFAGTGQKFFLMSIPLIIAFISLNPSKKINLYKISLALSCLILLASISFHYIGDKWLTAIFNVRLLILPATIAFQYYDFFSVNPPSYLSHSIFKLFFSYPYELEPWFMIGKVYYSHPQLSANAGMIADSYMNFRISGVLLLIIFFSFTLLIIDGLSQSRNNQIIKGTFILPIIFLLNGSFFSAILTGGLGLALVLAYLTNKTNNEIKLLRKL